MQHDMNPQVFSKMKYIFLFVFFGMCYMTRRSLGVFGARQDVLVFTL